MPIKIPKGFQRRKSSGNALEEVQNPPESSFKVFERADGKTKSFDGGHTLRHAENRPLPPSKTSRDGLEGPYYAHRFDAPYRGLGGMEASLSTGGATGSAASSFRLSTSSTNASSTDSHPENSFSPSTQRTFHDTPALPASAARPTGPFKTRTRKDSFGLGLEKAASPMNSSPHLPQPIHHDSDFAADGRDRTVSASTASTATPPRLFDSDLALEGAELDDFGNMFDSIGQGGARPVRSSPSYGQTSSPAHDASPLKAQRLPRGPLPTPLNLRSNDCVESSPFSWTSQDSQDRLMRTPSPSKTVIQEPSSAYDRRFPHSQSMPLPSQSPIPRIVMPDTQGQLRPVARKALPVRRKEPPPALPKHFSQPPTESAPVPEATTGIINRDTPPKKLSLDIDDALVESADLAAKWEEIRPSPPKPPSTNKVMTPAQFERYREQQDRDRRLGLKPGDNGSDSEDEKYSEDDEIERDRQAAMQRRKQEAHLAVYRQTMRKVTGEQAGSRPISHVSGSDLHSSLDPKRSGASSGNSAAEEEDEDVPLGILAAHGFPNKNRPPTRLTGSPSNSYLGPASPLAPAPTPSVAGESIRRGSLPAFARNLPQDPYFGAGLVNSSNRESLAMGGGSSVYGAPAGPSTGGFPTHPAGLVGVIAGEEKARAMRRGSPNAQGVFDLPGPPPHPGMSRSQTMGNVAHPGMLSPGDQAQIHMSQQMNQMMQMQWQWMQQMQQMVQMQGGPPPGMPQNMLVPPNPGQRPQSMPLPEVQMQGHGALSTLSPSMASWNRPQSHLGPINSVVAGIGYAPSIAPSERSNVGLAPRYRPVSTAHNMNYGAATRSSTFTSSTTQPWTSYDTGRTSPSGATIRTVNPSKKAVVADDDDDEQGWTEMKQKRDKKQRNWKLRKTQSGFQDLLPPGI